MSLFTDIGNELASIARRNATFTKLSTDAPSAHAELLAPGPQPASQNLTARTPKFPADAFAILTGNRPTGIHDLTATARPENGSLWTFARAK